jgi:hypothetical protein
MSIRALIQSRVDEGMLFPLLPKAAGATALRAMYVSEALRDFLENEHPDPDWDERIGLLQADLEVFATMDDIYPKYLFLLYHPREAVWEIRSIKPNPSIRVLGRFAEKDVFVATNYALREQLGGWQSRAWRDVKVMSRTIWTHLFHTYTPIVTTNVDDVVSGAINDKFFKTG